MLLYSFAQTEIYFLTIWRLDIQDQDVSGVHFFQVSPGLVEGHFLPASSHGPPSVHTCSQSSSSFKDTSHIRLGPTLMTSFNLTSSSALSPTLVTF